MAKQAQLDEVRKPLNKVNKGIAKADKVIDVIEAGAEKVTEVVETGLENVADVVPETINTTVVVTAEGTRGIVHFFGKPKVMATTIGIVGLAVGAGVSYYVTKRYVVKKSTQAFEQVIAEETEAMKRFYEKRSTRKQPYSSPEEAAEALVTEDALVDDAVEALEKYEGDQPPPGIISSESDPREGSNSRVRYDKVETKRDSRGRFVPDEKLEDAVTEALERQEQAEPKEVVKNVFSHAATIDGWDQEREEATRNPEEPYVISHDEFMEGPLDDQRQLTYYAGDDILADEQELHLEDVEGLVGQANLQLFGHGSRDSNIVYVRNEKLEVDFEVSLNKGTYAEQVIGLEHSDRPRIRKGRRDDDG